jgi:hypothetical protein
MKERNILTTNIDKETLPKLKMIEQKRHCNHSAFTSKVEQTLGLIE